MDNLNLEVNQIIKYELLEMLKDEKGWNNVFYALFAELADLEKKIPQIREFYNYHMIFISGNIFFTKKSNCQEIHILKKVNINAAPGKKFILVCCDKNVVKNDYKLLLNQFIKSIANIMEIYEVEYTIMNRTDSRLKYFDITSNYEIIGIFILNNIF